MHTRAFNTLFLLILFGLLSIIVLIAVSSYRSNEVYKDSSNWVKRTLKAINTVEQISSASKDLQLESAGYYYTGDAFVYLDPGVIHHILSNLVSNAIKYSPHGSPIEFRTRVAENKIHFSVKDSGIGISPTDQQFLFQRFFRADNTGTIKGTGLGLHIVKRYVDMMEGNIRVVSEPGRGSEFIVEINAGHSESLP